MSVKDAKLRRKNMRHSGGRCDWCHMVTIADNDGNGYCPRCALYNAAVEALHAAALSIARSWSPASEDAWMNEYGVFASVDGIKRQVGTPEQAAPFVALTQQTLKVDTFWREGSQAPTNAEKDGNGE